LAAAAGWSWKLGELGKDAAVASSIATPAPSTALLAITVLQGTVASIKAQLLAHLAHLRESGLVLEAGELVELSAEDLFARKGELRIGSANPCVTGRLVPLPLPESDLAVEAYAVSSASSGREEGLESLASKRTEGEVTGMHWSYTKSMRRDEEGNVVFDDVMSAATEADVPQQRANVVYMLHNPLESNAEFGEKALCYKSVSFRHLDPLLRTLPLDTAEEEGVIVTELNLATSAQEQAQCGSVYEELCVASIRAVLQLGTKVVVAFGLFTRARWLEAIQSGRVTDLVCSARAVSQHGAHGLSVMRVDGSELLVWFSFHPCLWSQSRSIARTLSVAHGRALPLSPEFDSFAEVPLRDIVWSPGSTRVVDVEIDADTDAGRRYALANGVLTHNCGNLYAGPETDTWSCGVILYALLCGSLPFDDENIRALFRKIKNGIYSIPSHVSPGARELLSRMLVVDPLKRISIAQVMQHPWYRQHLPLYLSLSAEQQIAQTQALDEGVLSKVISMGFPRDRVLKALSVGHELLTSRKYANQLEARKMAVIYNLLRDNKRRKDLNVDECVPDQTILASTVANRPKDSANNVASDLNEDTTGMSPWAAATAKQLIQLHMMHEQDVRNATNIASGGGGGGAGVNVSGGAVVPLLGGRWQLGLCSNLDAQSVMNEVYRVLRKFNFEWKVLSLFKLKARYPAGLIGRDGKQVPSSEVCKIGIQLYKTSGRDGSSGGAGGQGMMPPSSTGVSTSASNTPTISSPALGPSGSSGGSPPPGGAGLLSLSEPVQGNFVLDMQKLCGQTFHYLELSTHLLGALQHIHPHYQQQQHINLHQHQHLQHQQQFMQQQQYMMQ